jgi:hypothetical protein
MELNKVDKFSIGDKVFYAKRTNRAIIEYESSFGKKLTDIATTEEMLQFFFCCAKAGFRSMGESFEYSYEQFLDLIDDYPNETFQNFMKAIYKPEAEEEKDLSKKK